MQLLASIIKTNLLQAIVFEGGLLITRKIFAIIIINLIMVSVIFSGCTTHPNELSLQNSTKSDETASSELSNIFTDEVQYWGLEIKIWAKEWNLDPNLVATVMQIESCGDPIAISVSDARGLFQVMPYHFEAGENTFNANTNAKRGLSYLSKALDSGNNQIILALAGYNGGITGAKQAPDQWNNEMQRYVYWGENIYQDAVSNSEQSQVLDEWLHNGGASLCSQARINLGLN